MPHQDFKMGIGLLIMIGLATAVAQPALAAVFVNPLGATTFAGIIVTATRFLLGLVGFLAMASLVWGGVLYIVSLGNDAYVQQAKKVILWAVIGLIIIILSYVIISTVSGFLGIKSV